MKKGRYQVPECTVCGRKNEFQRILYAREMHDGTGEMFTYGSCDSCGSLQRISEVKDMSKYYSYDSYYSFQNTQNGSVTLKKRAGLLIRFLLGHEMRNGGRVFKSLCMHMLPQIRHELKFFDELESVFYYCKSRDDRILDVGCGSGQLLGVLEKYGYRNLTGIDPYGADKEKRNVKIIKTDIFNFNSDKKYDCVIFRHSLEHMDRPYETLLEAKKILSDKGVIIIAVPMLGDAWQRYQADWVELDAPRHTVIFSYEGMACLIERLAMQSVETVYDGTEFAYTGSEMYLRNISLIKQRTMNAADVLDEEIVRSSRRLSDIANKKGEGYANRAKFILRTVSKEN